MRLLVRPLLSSAFICCTTLACTAASTPPGAIAAGSLLAPQIRFEFAIYYPDAPVGDPMMALRQRLAASVARPPLLPSLPETALSPVVSARWDTHAQDDYTPPDARMLTYFGRGLTPAQASTLPSATMALVIDFAHPSSARMAALREADTIAEQVARDTHGLIWDNETREVFTPDAWHERRVNGWQGDLPDVRRHTVIHTYPNDPLYRAITLGMGKLGLPDIVVDDFAASDTNQAGNLINALSQALVEDGVVDMAGAFDLRLDSTHHVAVRTSELANLKDNATKMARLALVEGRHEEGDPANRLVRIAFDRYPGADLQVRQEALFSSLFGATDSVARIHHDDRLLIARDAARAKLPALRDVFNSGLQPGEFIQVKAPFETTAGGREWMWVEVTAWHGDRIDGLLQNDPDDVPSLRAGQAVTVSQADLFDYLHHFSDGRAEGNTTGAIIEQMEKASPQ